MNEFGEKARDFGEKLHYVPVRGMIFVEEWNLELRKNESIAHYETLDRMRWLNFYL